MIVDARIVFPHPGLPWIQRTLAFPPSSSSIHPVTSDSASIHLQVSVCRTRSTLCLTWARNGSGSSHFSISLCYRETQLSSPPFWKGDTFLHHPQSLHQHFALLQDPRSACQDWIVPVSPRIARRITHVEFAPRPKHEASCSLPALVQQTVTLSCKPLLSRQHT